MEIITMALGLIVVNLVVLPFRRIARRRAHGYR